MRRARPFLVSFLLLTLTRPAWAAPPDVNSAEVVEVRGRKRAKDAQTTIGAAEVREVPGAFGDPFRVIEIMPGVTPIASGLPFFFVRGAPPGNNGYYLDGIRVPLLYHVGAGPSVIHPGLIEKVEFSPGGYPARYGRFAGGILSGETRRPAEELHGEGNIRLFDAGALVESPFADGRGTVLAAGRYSYTAALISVAAPNALLDYWDYQGRLTWKLGAHDTVGVFGFGSHDYFGQKGSAGETTTALATEFHRLDARWDHELPNQGKMRTAVTIGSDSTGSETISGVRDRMIGARVYVEQPVGKYMLVRGGADATVDHYDLPHSNAAEPGRAEELYPPRTDFVAGAHLDAVIQAAETWQVTPGIRADVFGSVKDQRELGGNGVVPAVDPRLLSRLRLSNAVTLVSTLGISHQPPAFFVPVPGLQLGRLRDGLQTSVQSSQGLEVALPLAFSVTPTFFYHRYLGLTDFATTCGLNDDSPTSDDSKGSCMDTRVGGRTLGFEMLLRRSLTQKLTGWISYTLSRTTRTTRTAGYDPATLQDDFAGARSKKLSYQEIPGDFDRTHVLNAIGAYDLGRGWRLGARFTYYTGRPYSPIANGYTVPPFNQQRYPDFYRIDARMEKSWHVGATGRISFVVEWLNVTLRKEATTVHCDTRQTSSIPDPATCTFVYIGPVTIPSVGVEGAF